jgi:uncharacterized Zn finger protein
MERICQPTTGLFPTPREIHLQCSCPDSVDMCKHVAAVKARATTKTGGKTAAAKRKAKTTSRKKPVVRKSGAKRKRKKTGRRNA